MGRRTFTAILIKPSHYDEDGYVIQWLRSTIPSNSLASAYGLLAECAEAKVLGPDVDIAIEAYDECNTIINIKRAIRNIRASGAGFVGLVGVQSNQYPRALDMARQFRAAGITVVIGGFHVSGCISMLPELPADLKEALALGITLFAGEAEGRMAALLHDIDAGTLKPIYNYLSDMPEMNAATLPVLPRWAVTKWRGTIRASMPAAAVRSNAASAPSSTCRAASRAIAPPTTSSRSCASMPPRTSPVSSSPTTTSRATATGSRSSIA